MSFMDIFKKKAVSLTPESASLAADYQLFCDIALYLGQEMDRDRRDNSISLNSPRAAFKDGTKEWLRIEHNAVYIRYYDTDTSDCETLYKMSLDTDNECFVLQRKYIYNDAKEALSVFVNIMDEYADSSFMRPLKERLAEKGLININVEVPEIVEQPKAVAAPEAPIK